MTSREIAAIVDAGIPFLGGLICTLYGFRVIGKKPGEDRAYDERFQKYLKHLRWLGPVLVAWSLIRLTMGLYEV
jgi:hypothetical protein